MESLQKSLTVVQHQLSRAAEQPLPLDVDGLRQQITNHDELVQYLMAHEPDVKTIRSDLDDLGSQNIGRLQSGSITEHWHVRRFAFH